MRQVYALCTDPYSMSLIAYQCTVVWYMAGLYATSLQMSIIAYDRVSAVRHPTEYLTKNHT